MEATDYLSSEFPDYLTEFKTARDPAPGRLSGAHVDDIWGPLRRMTTQLDVLREIRRELRKKQADRLYWHPLAVAATGPGADGRRH